MAAQKHRLQFTDANGKKAANAGFQGKLLTDAEKAKNRREQLRFGKKETVVPADPSSTKSVPRKGVAFHDTLSGSLLSCAGIDLGGGSFFAKSKLLSAGFCLVGIGQKFLPARSHSRSGCALVFGKL